MRVLFVEPPKDFWFVMGEYVSPPLGILALAGYLEAHNKGVEIEVVDCQAERLDWDGLERRIESVRPDLVATSSLSTCNAYSVLRTVELIKKIDPEVATVVGGQHFSALADESLRGYPHIDFVVRGEGEQTLSELAAALGEKYMARARSAERLAVGWLERRIRPELDAYPGIVEIGHAIVAEAFSSRVIHPGITTTDDVVWWMRKKMLELGLEAWFQPSVDIQAPDQSYEKKTDKRSTILPGDLLHCDVGFYYLRLATDHQQNAYVLRAGEDDAPESLRTALASANRLQDIHAEEMVAGRTGNQILRAALERARGEGIKASIYTHPLGYHGHAAGPTIGLWDRQDGVPGAGDYELFEDTCYAIELNAKSDVPEWGEQEARMSLEEDAVFSGGRLRWLSGRQTRLPLIG